MSHLTVVISGSFRKHLAEIQQTIREFTALGIEALSPSLSEAINPGAEFVILETDDTNDSRVLEHRHLSAIRKTDVLYLCNVDGYIGFKAAYEFGFAGAISKKVFCREPIGEQGLEHSATTATPQKIKEILSVHD